MAKYFELRKPATNGTLSSDMMRHLHTRQHLGKAVIICGNPRISLGTARKQWLKISRNVQNRRAGTLNADKILKYTHAVTYMQHMQFTQKLPEDDMSADVFFLLPEMAERLPAGSFSLYLDVLLDEVQARQLVAQLPDDALVVDYRHHIEWEPLGLEPKGNLDERVRATWQELVAFLESYRIDVSTLSDSTRDFMAMEEALDILLGAHGKFLRVASDFQRALELARPQRLTKDVRQSYDAAILLAHRVQALTPGAFSQSFLETYDEDDSYFLYDRSRDLARFYYLASTRRLMASEKAASLRGKLSLAA